MKTTLDILRDARALIETPDRWIKGEYGRVLYGTQCYCLVGAVDQASDLDTVQFNRAQKVLLAVVDEDSIVDFNDAPRTTHGGDVMAAFDRAIAVTEAAVAA